MGGRQAGQGVLATPTRSRGCATPKALPRNWMSSYPSAAASLREGLEEMFTVARLGIDGRLAKTLTTSNPIESMISIARNTNRNVTRWRDGQMVLRWTAAGMLNAERILPPHQGPQANAPARGGATPTRPPRHRICQCRRLKFTVDRHPKSTRLGTCSHQDRIKKGDGQPQKIAVGSRSSSASNSSILAVADTKS